MHLGLKNIFIFIQLVFLGSALITTTTYAQLSTTDCSDYLEYRANNGETLRSISNYFGSNEFAGLIQSSNPEIFGESELINSEVVLKIPYKVYQYRNTELSVQEVLEEPFCYSQKISGNKNMGLDVNSQNQVSDTSETDELQEFRDAFETLIEEERSKEQEEVQAKTEQQIFIELDGLVLDETRSKIGRDFYDIFYQQWQAPSNSSNYTITISEQPTPTLGSLITVRINDQQVFQYRLQPRYEIIKQVAEYAVQVTAQFMEENRHQYTIY